MHNPRGRGRRPRPAAEGPVRRVDAAVGRPDYASLYPPSTNVGLRPNGEFPVAGVPLVADPRGLPPLSMSCSGSHASTQPPANRNVRNYNGSLRPEFDFAHQLRENELGGLPATFTRGLRLRHTLSITTGMEARCCTSSLPHLRWLPPRRGRSLRVTRTTNTTTGAFR